MKTAPLSRSALLASTLLAVLGCQASVLTNADVGGTPSPTASASPTPPPSSSSTPSPTPSNGNTPPITAAADRIATFVSGVPWFSTAGGLFNAHSIGVFKVGAKFYVVGERRDDDNQFVLGSDYETYFNGVNCYSSDDLTAWKYEGLALAPGANADIDGSNVVERPKVLYSPRINKYVMYMHLWSTQSVGFALSNSPCGPYDYQGSLPYGNGIAATGDLGVFADDDGSAYVLSTNGGIYVLDANYTSVASTLSTGAFNGSTEAPAMFKAQGTYFFLTSSQTWWHSNDNQYATATNMNGPWVNRGYFAPAQSLTFESQTTSVVPIVASNGNTQAFIYVGDRWCDKCLTASAVIWQPLTVDGNTLSMATYEPVWTLNFNDVSMTSPNDTAASFNDADHTVFSFDGGWAHVACNSGDICYDGDNTYTNSPNALGWATFTGVQARIYAFSDAGGGLMGVSLCGADRGDCGAEIMVNMYETNRKTNKLVYNSPYLANGTYTLRLRSTGLNSYYASNAYVSVDRLAVAMSANDVILSGSPNYIGDFNALVPVIFLQAGRRRALPSDRIR